MSDKFTLTQFTAHPNNAPSTSTSLDRFTIQSFDEAHDLAKKLSLECPNPRMVEMGLTEMLINAIEHGNLKITGTEKALLQHNNTWLTEVAKRIQHIDNRDKRVEVQYMVLEDEIRFLIIDQGQGFDFQKYLDVDDTSPYSFSGRGILLAKTVAFDEVNYKGNGQIVECCVYRHKQS